MDVDHFLSAAYAERHITSGNHDRRHVDTGCAHKMSGDDGVACGKEHHAVEEVAFHGEFHLVGDGVAAGNLDIFGVLEHHTVADTGSHHLEGKAACVADTCFHALRKLSQMHVARIVLIPGIHNRYTRPVLFFCGITHSAHQSATALTRLTKFPLAFQNHIVFKCQSSLILSIRRRTVLRPRISPARQ